MSYTPLKRPKFSLLDKLYLKAIAEGLCITLKHLVLSLLGKSRNKKQLGGSGIGVTMQYPEYTWDKHLPPYYRGYPVLVRGDDGRERCVSCQLCEFICPARAIKITPGAIDPAAPNQKPEKAPKEFEIDMLRCIYCGMCQEVCPEQAIFMSQGYTILPTSRQESVRNKQQLYELGGKKNGLIDKWNQHK